MTAKLKQVLGLLLLIVAIMTGQSAWASIQFESNCVIDIQPTVDNPYIRIRMPYYDENGNNSFFTHAKIDGVAGPAIYVDGHYIGSADEELAWPGTTGTGNTDGAEAYCNNNSWVGNTYSKTYDGITYKIKFYDQY